MTWFKIDITPSYEPISFRRNMKLNKIEIDYFENRHYENEADKRSQQFRETAKRINDIVDYFEELGLDKPKCQKPNCKHAGYLYKECNDLTADEALSIVESVKPIGVSTPQTECSKAVTPLVLDCSCDYHMRKQLQEEIDEK